MRHSAGLVISREAKVPDHRLGSGFDVLIARTSS
jgi:hypothetical protein